MSHKLRYNGVLDKHVDFGDDQISCQIFSTEAG